jgi:MFS family permease
MMVVVYMFFAMYFGTLNDRNTVDRRVILCVAIIMWSLATALAGAAGGIVSLVIIRSLVGVGEAAYGTIAAPLLSDYYPKSERNLVFSFFYVAIPIGAALGFAIGAGVGACK